MNHKVENATVNEDTSDQKVSNSAASSKLVSVRGLEISFNPRNDREMGFIVDTVEDRILNSVFTAIDSDITPKIELAFRSINPSSGQDAAGVMATLETGGT